MGRNQDLQSVSTFEVVFGLISLSLRTLSARAALPRLGQGLLGLSFIAALLVPTLSSPAFAQGVGASVRAERVFDPKLAGARLAIESRQDGAGSYQAQLVVRDDAGRRIRSIAFERRQAGTTYTDTWTGHDERGQFVAPGVYRIVFETDRAMRETRVNVVRLGLVAMRFEDAQRGRRVRLAYHRPDPGIAGNSFAVDAAGLPWVIERSALGSLCLDQRDGSPLALPARWTGLRAPPRATNGSVASRGRSLPVAYPQGAQPRVTILMGDSAGAGGRAVDCGYPIPGMPIRVVLDQTTVSDELKPGATAVLEGAPLPSGLRRENLELSFRFLYNDGSSWRWVPGSVRTQHDCYVTVGAPELSDGLAWVAALDLAAQFASAGVSNAREVVSAMVRGINGGMGLVYENRAGAPAYTDAPRGLHNPVLDLGAFLDGRLLGRRVNCLDCASLVSSLARHAGVPTGVIVIGWDFDLNWLRGIGGTRFIHDLFGGAHSFSYHAIASIDRGNSVHDACLSIDADARPDRSPFQEALPTGLDFRFYRDQLTPKREVRVRNIGQAFPR